MDMLVYSGRLPPDALQALLVSVWSSQAEWAIVERVDDLQLLGARQDAVPDVTRWSQGRAFGPDVQVHWEQHGPEYRVVLADAAGRAPHEGLQPANDDWSGGQHQTHSYYVWHKENTRIGRCLDTERFGIAGRAKLQVVEYTDAAGVLRFYRYAGVRAALAEEVENESV